MYKGIFINLDRHHERRHSLLRRLDEAGFSSAHYLRFSAVDPSGAEPHLAKGLVSKGELGIWRSLVAVFYRVAKGDFDDIVHVVEDDAAFSSGAHDAVSAISDRMLSDITHKAVDIVFLDYFLNRDLFVRLVSSDAKLRPQSINLIPSEKYYLGCCTSFLVRRSSARYIAEVLERILETASVLTPVDLTLRSLVRLGAIRSYMTLPIMGASAWEEDEGSAIQVDKANAVRNAQRAHLLLKLLASGLKSSFWCAEKLAQIYDERNPLCESGDAAEFLLFFDKIRPRMQKF